jgi:hypothetical protein
MSEKINDVFSHMKSAVRINPLSNVRFIADELRHYGIKTNKTNNRDKVIFYQSSHLVATYNKERDGLIFPSFAIVSFKDLFHLIGKNPEGVDEQDIVRVWVISEKMEKRKILEIQGTSDKLLDKEESPDHPDIYVNLDYANTRRDDIQYSFKSKFATNKLYTSEYCEELIGIGDCFIIR